MTDAKRRWMAVSLVLGLACGDSGGDDEVAEGAPTCEPGAVIDCACPDGSVATQTCKADGSGYEACGCEGGEGQDTQSSESSTDTGESSTTGETSTSESTDTTSESGTTTDTTSEGPIGAPPVPEIFHPGDGEVRQVDTPIPWIGVANDPEDGALMGPALVWSSDLDGEFGVGTMFDAPLSSVGVHVITLTATDSDGQQGSTSIMLTLEP